MRREWGLGMAALLAGLVAAACGEPAVDVQIPQREGQTHVLDAAGILTGGDLEERLAAVAAQGLDVVVVAYETSQANCGEAFRAGGEIVTAWDADIAVVAVARPGDFASTRTDRERCLGIRPRDEFAVPRGLREEIVEELVPPLAAENRWDEAFAAAVDRLAEDLA